MQTEKRAVPRREDPPPRPVEQTANRGGIEGNDPTKHYVWVSEVNDPTINTAYYKSLGYKVCQYDPNEARPTIGNDEFKQGDAIKSFGMVLMEAPRALVEQRDQDGWSKADRIEETIRNRDVEPEERVIGVSNRRTASDDRKKWGF